MSSFARLLHRAAVVLLMLAAIVMGLGVWGQIEHNRFQQDRAAASLAEGMTPQSAMPIPSILRPFEEDMIPAFLAGDSGKPTVFGVFSRIGGALGIIGLLLFAVRTASATQAPAAIRVEEETEPPSMQEAQAIPMAEWQRRLKQRMADEHREVAAVLREPRRASRSGAMVYRTILLVVVAAFVILSAAVLLGNSQGGVDIRAFADQIGAQVQAAVAGDRSAMISLGKIAGIGLCALLILGTLLSRLRPSRRNAIA
jgi:hypothetical protein